MQTGFANDDRLLVNKNIEIEFKKLEKGDIISLNWREGDSYRHALLVVESLDEDDWWRYIRGYDLLNDFYKKSLLSIQLTDVTDISLVTKEKSMAGRYIKDLIQEIYKLRAKISKHNKFVIDSWVIKD